MYCVWRYCSIGLRQAAELSDIQLIELDNRYDPDVAVQNAEQLIKRRIDLAIEFQTFAAVAAAVSLRFREAGVPLIAIDIPHPGATYYGADNYRAGRISGRALARWAKTHWHGKADQVLLVDLPAAGPLAEARVDGALSALREALPSVRGAHIARFDGGGLFADGLAEVRKRVRPGLRTLICAANDPSGVGALRAVEEAGCAEHCAVVTHGASVEIRSELRRTGSSLIGSVAFFPERYGENVLRLALAILAGRPMPPAVFVEHKLITPENVDHVYPNDRLLREIEQA